MSSLLIDIPAWVGAAPLGKAQFRRAVHSVLFAIATDTRLREMLCMKGGILMALHYGSPRFTTDIDFSTPHPFNEALENEVIELLTARLAAVPELLGYDIACRLQSYRVKPRRGQTYITINMTVGYAEIGSRQHTQMVAGQHINTAVSIDYSFRESIPDIEAVEIAEDETLCVYGISTLVAEKYRALLQQPIRGRTRRQDAYDIEYLLRERPELRSLESREAVLSDLMIKCADREICPNPASMDNPEVRTLSQQEFATLEAELPPGELPDFDTMFDIVVEYFRSLPWPVTVVEPPLATPA